MILILDDHPLVCQGLSAVIQMHRGEEEVLQANTVREAIAMMEAHEVDLAFVDVNLGQESGFDFLRWSRENRKDLKTAVITASSRQRDFAYARELGVVAYLLKDAFIDDITYGLKVIERGGKFYSATLMDAKEKTDGEEDALSLLTEREKDVLSLLGFGCSNAKISSALFISEGTTKKHISNILGKLQMESRVEAILLANKNSACLKRAMTCGMRPDAREEVGSA